MFTITCRHSLEAECPQARDQLDQEEAREDETGFLQGLVDGGDPCIVLDPAVAVDQGDEDVGEQARDVEGDQGQHQVVFLLGDEQVPASSPPPFIRADFAWAVLLVQAALAVEEGLLLAGLVHRWEGCSLRLILISRLLEWCGNSNDAARLKVHNAKNIKEAG